jgi:hypothetical protein
MQKLKTAYWMEQVWHRIEQHDSQQASAVNGQGQADAGTGNQTLASNPSNQTQSTEQQRRLVRQLREQAIDKAQTEGSWLRNPGLDHTIPEEVLHQRGWKRTKRMD